MAVLPGSQPGDTTTINGVEYTWDGVAWNKSELPQDVDVDTSQVKLTNPINAALTQEDANIDFHNRIGDLKVMVSDTPPTTQEDGDPLEDGNIWYYPVEKFLYVWENLQWNHVDAPAEVVVSNTIPDPLTTDEGTLWVDEVTYDLFVLSGGQWIDLTASPDMSDYVRDSDLQFILSEYLRKRDAFDQYYGLSDMFHFLNPNGTFNLHLGTGVEFDNIFRRLNDLEYEMQWVETEIGNLGGGTPPPPPAAVSGEWKYVGYSSGNPGVGNFGTNYLVNDWSQITKMYVNETDLDGEAFDFTLFQGMYVDVHRYENDPNTGADYGVSAVLYVTTAVDRGDYGELDVVAQPGTYQGIIRVGDTFSVRSIQPGTN